MSYSVGLKLVKNEQPFSLLGILYVSQRRNEYIFCLAFSL